MASVREINEPAELADIASTWAMLLERTTGATFFHSREWLEVYWKHFGAHKRLRVLVVSDNGEAIGILPLIVRRARRSEPFRALAYPLDGWGSSYGPIGPDPAATLAAGFEHIRRTPRDWHFIELTWIDALLDAGRTKAALDGAGFATSGEVRDQQAIMDLTRYRSWDAYVASRSSKWRNELRRQERKLAERGTVAYVRHRASTGDGGCVEPRWDLYDACLAISEVSWQGSAQAGSMLNKQSYRPYFADCHRAAVACGAVDMSLMFVGEVPAAFSICYAYRGYVSHSKTAYDPAFAREGAGTILQARSVADSFARGDHTLDLGPEVTAWKRLWLTHLQPSEACVHFPPGSIAAQAVRAKRALERWLRNRRASRQNGLNGGIRSDISDPWRR